MVISNKKVRPLRPYMNPPLEAERMGMSARSIRALDDAWCDTHISCILVCEFFEEDNTGFSRSEGLTEELGELTLCLSSLRESIEYAAGHLPMPSASGPSQMHQYYCSKMRDHLVPFITQLEFVISEAHSIQKDEANTPVSTEDGEQSITELMLDALENEFRDRREYIRIFERGYPNVILDEIPESQRTPSDWKFLHLFDLLLKIYCILQQLWRSFEQLLSPRLALPEPEEDEPFDSDTDSGSDC